MDAKYIARASNLLALNTINSGKRWKWLAWLCLNLPYGTSKAHYVTRHILFVKLCKN